MTGPSASVESALAAIDAANAEDPNLVATPEGPRAKELVHAERMSAWLERLDPHPDDAQRLAARAHHFRRWTSPRSAYPEGRAGYLRWRREARRRHAEEVSDLLHRHDVAPSLIEEVAAIVRKERLGSDPRVQVHEDALCLTFFELQGLATTEQLGDRAAAVVAKTLAKMSTAGREALSGAELDPAVRAAIDAVTTAGTEAPSGPA